MVTQEYKIQFRFAFTPITILCCQRESPLQPETNRNTKYHKWSPNTKTKYKNVDVILEPHWSARGGCVGWEKVVEQLPCYLSPLRAALHVRRLEYKYKDSQIKLKPGIKINSENFPWLFRVIETRNYSTDASGMKLISLFDNNDIDDATKESYDNPDDDNDAGDYDDNDDDVVSLFLLLSEWPAVGDHSTTRDLPPPCSNYNHRRHHHYHHHCHRHH